MLFDPHLVATFARLLDVSPQVRRHPRRLGGSCRGHRHAIDLGERPARSTQAYTPRERLEVCPASKNYLTSTVRATGSHKHHIKNTRIHPRMLGVWNAHSRSMRSFWFSGGAEAHASLTRQRCRPSPVPPCDAGVRPGGRIRLWQGRGHRRPRSGPRGAGDVRRRRLAANTRLDPGGPFVVWETANR